MYTVWCVNFVSSSPNLILTGGDDARLNLYDLRVSEENPIQLLKFNKRAHTAGVCCINFDPTDKNYFVTGSYDENIRLWDIRKFDAKAEPIAEMNLGEGGGVWRAKYCPWNSELIGCAAMRNHFQVLRVKEKTGFETLEVYKGHESLCYGIDWKNDKATECFQLASCSFYDNTLSLWDFNMPKTN